MRVLATLDWGNPLRSHEYRLRDRTKRRDEERRHITNRIIADDKSIYLLAVRYKILYNSKLVNDIIYIHNKQKYHNYDINNIITNHNNNKII